MINVAILGAGGLGKGMAQLLQTRPGFRLVGIADRHSYVYEPNGIAFNSLNGLESLQNHTAGVASERSVLDLMGRHGKDIQAVFMALPNLPVDFYTNTVQTIAEETPFQGVMVDALKRTIAMELLLPLNEMLAARNILYITGAGATPGFLTTVAAVAAQSFVEVLAVDIQFGVGIARWEDYKATIREDFLHLKGFDTSRVMMMSDADIQQELDARNGLLELVNMEHADDLILEMAGICPRDRVTVGGLVDTRNAKKPVSTTVTVRGKFVSGEEGVHTFTLSDASTMVDNVCGPALGFMARGVELSQRGMAGMMTSAEMMPKYAAPLSTPLNPVMPSRSAT
jgi:hypothetical protein